MCSGSLILEVDCHKREGYGLFGLILAALLLPGKNDSLLFHPELF